ncbi:MAG: hypothetical protein PHH13_01640 [Candidatus Peribacteraceae bacterium]|nr:hypothetical protein [Candidatus Peribacteraceae bacterium]
MEDPEVSAAIQGTRTILRAAESKLGWKQHSQLSILLVKMCRELEKKIEARYPHFREAYPDENIRIVTLASLNYHRLIGSTMSRKWMDESHARLRELDIDPVALEEEVDRAICFLSGRFRMIFCSVARRFSNVSSAPDRG